VNAAATAIPGLGDLIAFLGILYAAYLAVLATLLVQRLSTGKSVIVALAPAMVLAGVSFAGL
jgi:hypothetical protein